MPTSTHLPFPATNPPRQNKITTSAQRNNIYEMGPAAHLQNKILKAKKQRKKHILCKQCT